jgi:hypothetical protein
MGRSTLTWYCCRTYAQTGTLTKVYIVLRTREALPPAYDRASDLKNWGQARSAHIMGFNRQYQCALAARIVLQSRPSASCGTAQSGV